MKRAISITCLAAAFAVGLSAQAPSTSAQAPSTSAMAQSDSKSVTLTGCLRAGEAPGSFVLANTKIADKAAAGASTATPTTGATGTAGSTTTINKDLENATVKLTGSPAGVTLGDHVGHTVQITGTPAPQTSTAAAPASPEPGAAASASKPQPSLNITSFSMVSGTCSM